jgi:hypothetical protein
MRGRASCLENAAVKRRFTAGRAIMQRRASAKVSGCCSIAAAIIATHTWRIFAK